MKLKVGDIVTNSNPWPPSQGIIVNIDRFDRIHVKYFHTGKTVIWSLEGALSSVRKATEIEKAMYL
jgi:hypothetical protein